MRTATIEIYQFNELSDCAKETARAWYRDTMQYDDWWDFIFEDAKVIGKLIGINVDDIYFSGFYSQGYGACFVGDYSYQKGSVKKIRGYSPEDKDLLDIAENLASVQRRYFYQLTASVTKTGRYNHEYSVTIDVEDSRQDWWENVAKEGGDIIIESLRDFMRWVYTRLESEYEYLNSDDVVDKSIQCNEYEFKANGEIYSLDIDTSDSIEHGIRARIEPVPTDPAAIDGAILEESVVSAGNMENDDKYMDSLNS